MRNLVIVNASPILKNSQARALVKPLQTQIDRDFLPAWGTKAEEVKVSFASRDDIPDLHPNSWPIFLNRHSTDTGALGWHDDDPGQNINIYSRVFVGDCINYGLDWGVTLSHEALELILDPDIKRVWKMPNGRLAALEACDAVEDDSQAYSILGHKMSNFVLPAYFSTGAGPYDFRKVLKKPCPALSPGGYMSVTDVNGNWTQVTMDRKNGLAGRRALSNGYRRSRRARLPVSDLEVVSL